MAMEQHITTRTLLKMKQDGQKINCVTAYDAIFGRIADEAGMHVVLVGDSAGSTVLGYGSTIPVTMEESIMLTKAVSRGVRHAMLVGDMPFMSYQANPDDALLNAGRYLKECNADAIKLEGGVTVLPLIKRMVTAGIPVMAHIGLLPQSVLKDGGYRSHGKTEAEAKQLMEDALAVQEAGAFSVVLECIPAELAKKITKKLSIPTIGIGAGPSCDGQIQVITDILGLGGAFVPKHARQFAQLAKTAKNALQTYAQEVENGTFPAEENTIHLKK